VFLGFQLRHPQEMAEHVEPMPLRQPGQFRGGFGNECRGLVRLAGTDFCQRTRASAGRFFSRSKITSSIVSF
jgi:hypothetical protein